MFVNSEWLRLIYGTILPTFFVAMIAAATFLGIRSLVQQQEIWKKSVLILPTPQNRLAKFGLPSYKSALKSGAKTKSEAAGNRVRAL